MSDESSGRHRANDALLIEMHGMLSKLAERMENHVEWDEKIHEETQASFRDISGRLKPVEDMHDSLRTAGKVGAVIATPALLAIGAGIWAAVKNILSHAGVDK